MGSRFLLRGEFSQKTRMPGPYGAVHEREKVSSLDARILTVGEKRWKSVS